MNERSFDNLKIKLLDNFYKYCLNSNVINIVEERENEREQNNECHIS